MSALLRLNSPIGKAYLLKEDLRPFWAYRSTAWAAGHLRQWLWRASHSRLEPFQKLARMLRTHLDGVLTWARIRVTNGALEGMNNKVKVISHRAFGYRTSWTYIAHIYHLLLGGAPAAVTLLGDQPDFSGYWLRRKFCRARLTRFL